MRHASSLYDKCRALFADYPLAVQAINRSGTMRSMILMLQDGAHDGFFVLSGDFSQREALFWVWAWPAGSVSDIDADGTADIPEAATNAVTQGVPIPRDGSLFAWTPGGAISALVVVYTGFTPATPEPGWAVMPLAGIPETQWPPFTGHPLFGNWTWDRSQAASVIPLDELVAGNPGTVFWVDTKATLGSDCCAVARDLTSPGGCTLRRGRYVYYQVLQADKLVPSLGALLTDHDNIDLAARFAQMTRPDSGSLTPNECSY